VGKGRLKERCGLESQTNFFQFKKSPNTECELDSRIYGISSPTSGTRARVTNTETSEKSGQGQQSESELI